MLVSQSAYLCPIVLAFDAVREVAKNNRHNICKLCGLRSVRNTRTTVSGKHIFFLYMEPQMPWPRECLVIKESDKQNDFTKLLLTDDLFCNPTG